MSSTFSIHPHLLAKGESRDSSKTWPTANHGAAGCYPPPRPPTTSPFAPTSVSSNNNLSPYSQVTSCSASPTLNNASTPADSLSVFSEHYPSSDLSENADPFFGVDFNDDGSTPAFLDDPSFSVEDSSDHSEPFYPQTVSSAPEQNGHDLHTYPLSPELPASPTHATSASGEPQSPAAPGHSSPGFLSQAPSEPVSSNSVSGQIAPQLSADTTPSRESDTVPISGPTTAHMPCPSPRVTVSMWGRDQEHLHNSSLEDTESPTTVRATGLSIDDNFVTLPYQRASSVREEDGAWVSGATSGPGGWSPETRPVGEGASINEIDARRKIANRNREVGRWITTSESGLPPDAVQKPPEASDHDGIDQREIALGNETENKYLPGQIYYTEGGGPLTEEDFKLMRQRVWADAPAIHRILRGDSERSQPESSRAAMENFNQMCQETGSVLSRSATWGTRRRSLPSIADMEGITSGSFLKKLSIGRERKPSILFKELRGLAKKPSVSQLLKRHRSITEDDRFNESDPPNRREARDSLAPPSRTTSWTKKQSMPSLNTALVSMATGAAAIGTTHARSGSISNVGSPKSPFNLGVKHTVLRRPRSKSDLPKGGSGGEESHPNLVGMWKKSGGPPVAQLSRGASAPDLDEDEDEDDDAYYEEGDSRTGTGNILDDITPNFVGFQQQVLQMNPKLAEQNTYLVDRIAHQQVVRYKALLNNKVKHMQQIASGTCPSGHMCIASGGPAIPFDLKGDSRGMDPLSTAYDGGSDGDGTPLEGVITAESFPPDIPMPPTNSLPAEFECRLCYSAKKFTKPSDWTKHVHEDVQPFTCTWDRCREPKIFKRKADWVRHENEGHRVCFSPCVKLLSERGHADLIQQHLEWWTCDVEDCRHTCYRRDNFLQHLVREHKFSEPKVKTKAAIKRAGAQDPTWQKVEQCHAETTARPQDEPCRFCGKTLPTWKKLTVHLAKHMETMSLPILRLVARKQLEVDTIISPVQEPPPRTFPPVKSESQQPNTSPNPDQSPGMTHQPGTLAYPSTQHTAYTYNPTSAFSNFYDATSIVPQQPSAMNLGLHQAGIGGGFQGQTGYQNLPVSSGSSYVGSAPYMTMSQQMEPFPAYMNPLGLQDASGNQIYDATGLDPTGGDQQQYNQQSSLSPYTRSPHQGHGGFFHQQR